MISRRFLESLPGFDPAFHLGEAAAVPSPGVRAECSEDDFQDQVKELAESRGWRVYHTYDSRRSREGFQDLVMVRLKRLIFAELKTETGKESRAQTGWRLAIENVGGNVEAYLWRPSDWARIKELLR